MTARRLILAAGLVVGLLAAPHSALAHGRDGKGSLDRTFGTGGKVTTDITGAGDIANALIVQTDGKLVAAGTAGADFALARYLRNGTLDSGFGVGGLVTTTFDPGNININQINALAVRDDKIVAAGSVITGQIDSLTFDLGMTRYRRDGALDTRFGVGGRVTTDFVGDRDQANALAVQTDGKLVAAGFCQIGDTPDFALARYRNN